MLITIYNNTRKNKRSPPPCIIDARGTADAAGKKTATETMKNFSLLLFLSVFLFPGASLSQPPEAPPAPVSVAKVVEEEVKKPVSLVGTARPARKSVISNEVAGIVENLVAEEGVYVKKGDVLAEIRSERISLALEELRHRRNEASSDYDLAEKEFRRTRELYEKGIVSARDMDRATSRRDSAQAALLRLENGLRKARYDLRASKIRAPFGGYVTEHHTEVGQWLEVGARVVTLVDIDTMEVTAALPERYLGAVSEGDPAEVSIGSLPGKVFEGKISSIVPDADPRARAFPLKVLLDNGDHLVKSSASSVVRIRIGESERIKLVPKDAVVTSPRGTAVFVVRDGAAHPVAVRTLESYGGAVHVEGALRAGEDVVVRGNERLMPMQKVRTVGP